MGRIIAAVALALAAGGAIPAPVLAQAAPVASRAEVVAAVRKAIAENYVMAGKRAALDAVLARGLASGRYAVADDQEFTRRVTDDLFAVAHDKHLSLFHNPGLAAGLAQGGQGDEVHDTAFFKAFARKHNHGAIEMRILPGNVRYIRYEGFVWTGDESRAAIDTAMAFLRDADAAILDLRWNGGGSPEAVKYLTSYWTRPGTKLVTFHMRGEAPKESVSVAVPGGPLSAPLYVLTSRNAASAAEEFVSHVARLKFGTLVGEPTAGAAFRNDNYPMPGGSVLSVSVGYPELPGGGNWEGGGVAPAIAVSADRALERAQQAAALKLAERASGPEKIELEWAAAVLGARVSPVAAALPLDRYPGRYGVRSVSLDYDLSTWRSYIKQNDLDWVHVSDGQYWRNAIARQYGVTAIPQSYLIGRDGRVISEGIVIDEDRIAEALKK